MYRPLIDTPFSSNGNYNRDPSIKALKSWGFKKTGVYIRLRGSHQDSSRFAATIGGPIWDQTTKACLCSAFISVRSLPCEPSSRGFYGHGMYQV